MKSLAFQNSPDLPEVDLYHHVSTARGGRLVHVAGQVSWEADGSLVAPGDLSGQIVQAYGNLARALATVGGTLHDLVDVTMYVVDLQPDDMASVAEGIERAAAAYGGTSSPPATLVGVTALHAPEHLVEVKAVAMVESEPVAG